MVLDRSGDPLMRLGLYGDDEVVAVWRRLGAESGLPLVVIQEDGAVSPMGEQLGRLKLGAVRIRRRHGLLNHRRPRFLTRAQDRPPAAAPAGLPRRGADDRGRSV